MVDIPDMPGTAGGMRRKVGVRGRAYHRVRQALRREIRRKRATVVSPQLADTRGALATRHKARRRAESLRAAAGPVRVPPDLRDSISSLYEQPSARKGRIVGLPNWRLPNLKRELKAKTLPKLATMLGTTRDQFYEADYDAYAYARYLVYYLQEQGKLQEFYKTFLEDKKDLTGITALESVLGEKLEDFEPKWRKWVLAIPYKR